jgi:hypothetical protein
MKGAPPERIHAGTDFGFVLEPEVVVQAITAVEKKKRKPQYKRG